MSRSAPMISRARRLRVLPIRGLAPVLACAAALLVAGPLGAAEPKAKAKEAEEKTGSVEIRITLKGKNQPASGATVILQGTEYSADGEGVLRLQKIRAAPHIASAELFRKEGGFLGFFAKTVRYVGFKDVFVEPDKKTSERLEIEALPEYERVCRSCHPDVRTREHRVVKCVHASDVELPEKYMLKIGAFNAINEKNRKEGKKYYPDIVYTTRIVKEKDREVEKYFLSCESCHTLHKSNGPRAFVKMPFEEKSVLCRGCHP